ncbi:hypothetical protein [uncultured Aquimarina sp.]|uniref:hypothetical protein n=1 Tax=uncultured Aquimarina sp. TaxID=575652 RepID=UPI00260B1007|nr:hypothetical protein [uncultured Aquimarina sp.]
MIINNINGNANLLNDEMTEIDNSGMTVIVEGTSPLITATTDINGNYSLKNALYGTTYTLIYEKEGFGIHKVFDVEHEDVRKFTLIPNKLELGQISNSIILENTAVINDNFIVLTVTRLDTEDLVVKRMRSFYHNSDDVSNKLYTDFSAVIGNTANPAALTFSTSFFTSLGFESGDTL